MPRRLMGVLITGEAVAGIIRSGRRAITVCSQIPNDAEFFTAYFDHDRNCFVAIFEHSWFEIVPEGVRIPLTSADVVLAEIEPIAEDDLNGLAKSMQDIPYRSALSSDDGH